MSIGLVHLSCLPISLTLLPNPLQYDRIVFDNKQLLTGVVHSLLAVSLCLRQHRYLESISGSMNTEQLATQVSYLIPHQTSTASQVVYPLPGLKLVKHHCPTAFEATLYKPILGLIVQGRKETVLGGQTWKSGAGELLVISHDLPVLARITEAPYMAALLNIEISMLRSLYDDVAEAALDSAHVRAMEVHSADSQLMDALSRYLALAPASPDAKVLGPLILKEIHYRLLMAPFGGMLRHLVRYDSTASAIARAIAYIRRDIRVSIAIPELAHHVGMSESSFFKHFKAITLSTPLQYQKDLRLLEAKRLLVNGETSVSAAAYEVGYESLTQFSREYARKFGVPPSKDLRNAAVQLAGREDSFPYVPA